MSFNAPIGTQAERDSGIVWPGHWTDANPYLNHYALGYHTGADLNLNFPNYDADEHANVVAMGDGTVTYAHLYSTQVWGNIIVIDHGVVDGEPLFSRYGHTENMQVSDGQAVKAGQQIANVGNAEGLFPYHLHFDISTTDVLRMHPSNWPKEDLAGVKFNYVDPRKWLQNHLTAVSVVGGGGPVTATDYFVVATLGLRVRQNHSTSATQVGILSFRDKVTIDDTKLEEQDAFSWAPVVSGEFAGDFIAFGPADKSDVYLSKNAPA